MKKVFLKDDFCRAFIQHSNKQHISYEPNFEIEYQGFKFKLPAKCKWDLFRPDIDLGGDIKSTACTTLKQCQEAVRHFDYDRSRAWYMNLANKNNDVLIFISKVNMKIFKIPIRRGDELYRAGLEKYQELAFRYWYLFGEVRPPADQVYTPEVIRGLKEISRQQERFIDYDLDGYGNCFSDADPGL